LIEGGSNGTRKGWKSGGGTGWGVGAMVVVVGGGGGRGGGLLLLLLLNGVGS